MTFSEQYDNFPPSAQIEARIAAETQAMNDLLAKDFFANSGLITRPESTTTFLASGEIARTFTYQGVSIVADKYVPEGTMIAVSNAPRWTTYTSASPQLEPSSNTVNLEALRRAQEMLATVPSPSQFVYYPGVPIATRTAPALREALMSEGDDLNVERAIEFDD